jgi:hypothetical protein
MQTALFQTPLQFAADSGGHIPGCMLLAKTSYLLVLNSIAPLFSFPDSIDSNSHPYEQFAPNQLVAPATKRCDYITYIENGKSLIILVSFPA